MTPVARTIEVYSRSAMHRHRGKAASFSYPGVSCKCHIFCKYFSDACPLTSTFVDLGGLGFMRCPCFRAFFPTLALTLRVRLLQRSTAEEYEGSGGVVQHGLEDFLEPVPTLVYFLQNFTKSSSMMKLFSATKLQIATYILGVCLFSVCTFESLSHHRNRDTFSALLLISCHRIWLHLLTVL